MQNNRRYRRHRYLVRCIIQPFFYKLIRCMPLISQKRSPVLGNVVPNDHKQRATLKFSYSSTDLTA